MSWNPKATGKILEAARPSLCNEISPVIGYNQKHDVLVQSSVINRDGPLLNDNSLEEKIQTFPFKKGDVLMNIQMGSFFARDPVLLDKGYHEILSHDLVEKVILWQGIWAVVPQRDAGTGRTLPEGSIVFENRVVFPDKEMGSSQWLQRQIALWANSVVPDIRRVASEQVCPPGWQKKNAHTHG
jgi:hypothetical protein